MSNTNSVIFGNLVGYFTARLNNDSAADHYYLQKYYGTNVDDYKANDVTANFTDSIVELAKLVKKFDVSTGTVPSLKSALVHALDYYIRNKAVLSGDSVNLKTEKDNIQTALKDRLTGRLDKDALSESNKFIDDLDFNKTVNVKDKKEAEKKDIVSIELQNYLKDKIKEHFSTDRIMGNNETVKNILEKLVNGQFSTAELNLFNHFMNVLDEQDNPVSVSAIDRTKLGNYRINLLTAPMTGGAKYYEGGSVPLLVNFLPTLQNDNRVRYNGRSKLVLVNDNKNLLKKVFLAAYSSDDDTKIAALLPGFRSDAMVTYLQPDMESLMRDVLSRSYVPSIHVKDDDIDEIDAALKGRWTRVGENSWRTTLENGEQVTYRTNDNSFDNLIREQVNNCPMYSDPNKCKEFLEQVATKSAGVEQLAKVALEMDKETTAQTVAKLHPKYALAILKSFGFHRKICRDNVAGRQLEKVQTVDEWKAKFVNTKFGDNAEKIKNNSHLLNFLKLLTQLVNGNPSVLNDYAGETDESTGATTVPKELADRGIVAVADSKNGKPVNSWSTIQNEMGKVYSSFSKGLTFDGLNTNSPFGIDNLFPSVVMPTVGSRVVGSTWGAMVGGAEPVAFLEEHQTGMECTNQIHIIMSKLLNNLKSKNKILSEEDIRSLNHKLATIKTYEQELYDTLRKIQLYSQLVNVMDAEHRKEIVTENQIKKYVEKYDHLLNRYQKTGNTLSTLISLLQDCSDGSGDCDTNAEL